MAVHVGLFCSPIEEELAMAEEDRRRAEEVRHAFEGFLDRLARAVADDLARTQRVAHPPRGRRMRPPTDREESSG
jgi:hypothetical protein